ncbi:MAG: sigma-70 family RNA polymerase sigma factor [Thermoleophilia bacterium]|nr:sigma-70 family RNA polymerase sigma factor [Thermoleophilia bacterium]
MSRPRGAAPTASAGEDSRLVVRVAAGDGNAFEELYRRYARPVYALALRRLGDREGAEEAVQETFAAVWRSARSFRPERGGASSWLYAIARNAVIDRFRARPEPVAEPPDEAADEPGPGERVESDWLAWRVHYAVAELPDREREVIELAYWSGLSQSEVAARLRLPLGTVKTRTRSALARLAEALDAEGVR